MHEIVLAAGAAATTGYGIKWWIDARKAKAEGCTCCGGCTCDGACGGTCECGGEG